MRELRVNVTLLSDGGAQSNGGSRWSALGSICESCTNLSHFEKLPQMRDGGQDFDCKCQWETMIYKSLSKKEEGYEVTCSRLFLHEKQLPHLPIDGGDFDLSISKLQPFIL